jgi:hypothetical protein
MNDIYHMRRPSELRTSLQEAISTAAGQGDKEVADALRRILAKIGPLTDEGAAFPGPIV